MSIVRSDKRVPAGILAILLGGLGIHKFYLGYTTQGVIMLLVTVFFGRLHWGLGAGIMGIIGLIEGILYLTKSNDDFYREYIVNKRPWF